MKKFVFCFLLLITITACGSTAKNVNFTMNAIKGTPSFVDDSMSISDNELVLVSAEEAAEAIGADYSFDNEIVKIKCTDYIVEFNINSDLYTVYDKNDNGMCALIANVNSQVINNKPMVPAIDLFETLGYNVVCNEDEQTITVSSNIAE